MATQCMLCNDTGTTGKGYLDCLYCDAAIDISDLMAIISVTAEQAGEHINQATVQEIATLLYQRGCRISK